MNLTLVLVGIVVAIIAAVGAYVGWLKYQNRKLRGQKADAEQQARKSERDADYAKNTAKAATATDEDLLDDTMSALAEHDSRQG